MNAQQAPETGNILVAKEHFNDKSDDDDTKLSSLTDLPSDIQVELLTYLDFRDMQMLRATNKYFRSLPSERDLERSKPALIQKFIEEEKAEILRSNTQIMLLFRKVRAQMGLGTEKDAMPTIEEARWLERKTDVLRCYACFRRQEVGNFSRNQLCRRRGKGHVDAAKRFCMNCGKKGNKWQLGMVITFQFREQVFCRRCLGLKPPPDGGVFRGFGLCRDCQLDVRAPGHRNDANEPSNEGNESRPPINDAEARALARYAWDQQRACGDIMTDGMLFDLQNELEKLRVEGGLELNPEV